MQEFFGAAVGIVVLVLVLQRLRVVRGVARRSQGPLLVATAVSVLVGLAWLGRVIAIDGSAPTFETIARATVLSLPAAVIAVILWSRLRRPQAADLVVELRTQTPATMRERLARALGDPTLEVAYRIEGGRYVDASGRPVELPEGGDRAVTSVTAGGEAVAVLIHDPALLDEPALVESVRATAGLVLENERLAAEVRSQLAEVRASRGRIVAAADAERRPHRAQSARRRTAKARHVVARRSVSKHPVPTPAQQTLSCARRTRSSRRSPSYASSREESTRRSCGTKVFRLLSRRSRDACRCR